MTTSLKRFSLCAALSLSLLTVSPMASAHRCCSSHASDISLLSALPIAVSVAAPVAVLSAGVAFTVVAVEATAAGSVWVLQRASDGVRMSVRFAGESAAAVGASVTVVAIGAGWVLSAAGEALCFIPNEIGASLLYNEPITR
ncbi:hypothetical protein [Ideonella sp.]|jgi:hypothetical protein|uniref:hypothetical protein n=1 Tax=Ideonella sp. TaxID=1929293 RepID=UPI0037BFC3BE